MLQAIHRYWLSIAAVLLIGFAGIQFIRPEINNPPVTGDLDAPPEVTSIIKRACYDCHSNETHLRWYDKVVPAYWTVASDVKNGRKALNFSDWQKLAPVERTAKLWEVVNQVMTGTMPVHGYTVIHPLAKVSNDDLEILKKYVSSTTINNPGDTGKINALDEQYTQWQDHKTRTGANPVTLNGIEYMPEYKNWRPISSTDRYDNGTMRVIFGNDIAINAIQENNINPWPNGAIFAKVAWDQVEDTEGNVQTGEFKQIEYMIKDTKRFASTRGWGWARFKTAQMVPYGKDLLFTTECINCHMPVKDNDLVFTFPVKF